MRRFSEIWCCDILRNLISGENPIPEVVDFREIKSGKSFKYEAALSLYGDIQFSEHSCLVLFDGTSKINCLMQLGIRLPECVIDLYAEFKAAHNDNNPDARYDLATALNYYNVRTATSGIVEMADMKLEWLRQTSISDIVLLTQAMLDSIDVDRALIRGRYSKALAVVESNGVPLDFHFLRKLRSQWDDIKSDIIADIDAHYGVYDHQNLNPAKFETWLVKNQISWPRSEKKELRLDVDTFREMAKIYPKIYLLKELQVTLAKMRLEKITVGSDGRNRCSLVPFKSRTSRNQPSTSKFIFGPSVWMRGLIKPKPGMGVAHIDYSQQEFAIAAVLSSDKNMQQAYRSGDPYLEFAKMAGVVPPDATKTSHREERELFKQCVLGVQYGMGIKSLAQSAGVISEEARMLMRYHKRVFADFWAWSDEIVNKALRDKFLSSRLGWRINIKQEYFNERSIRNFYMQANGAEILRLSIIMGVEKGIKICAPIHDALLIESPVDRLEADTESMKMCMVEAGRQILDDFELRVDDGKVCFPDRYQDDRGIEMWRIVNGYLN